MSHQLVFRRPNNPDAEYLRTGQMAAVCRVAPRTICKWCDRGLISNVIRLPGSGDRRVHRDDFLEFLQRAGFARAAAAMDDAGRAVLLVGMPRNTADPLEQVLSARGLRVHRADSAVAAARLLDSVRPAAALLHGSLGRDACRELCTELTGGLGLAPRVAVLVPEDAEPGQWLALEGVVELSSQDQIPLALDPMSEDESCATHLNGFGATWRTGRKRLSGPASGAGPRDPSAT